VDDLQIAEALGTFPIMCARVRRQWVAAGLEAVLSRKKRMTPTIRGWFAAKSTTHHACRTIIARIARAVWRFGGQGLNLSGKAVQHREPVEPVPVGGLTNLELGGAGAQKDTVQPRRGCASPFQFGIGDLGIKSLEPR
jgi:hypothetical protein